MPIVLCSPWRSQAKARRELQTVVTWLTSSSRAARSVRAMTSLALSARGCPPQGVATRAIPFTSASASAMTGGG